MSKQNQKTLEVYNQFARKYLDNTINLIQKNPIKFQKEQVRFENFLLNSFQHAPKNGTLLEIGAGDGVNSAFLQKSGFKIIASDLAQDFLKSCLIKNLTTAKINIITDQLPENLSGVLAWRVFVHFTKKDLEITFSKIYRTLLPGGIFVFNILNKEVSGIDSQWTDFPGDYQIGADRFFAYYLPSDINQLATKTGFIIDDFFKQSSEFQKDNWLCYVLRKP